MSVGLHAAAESNLSDPVTATRVRYIRSHAVLTIQCTMTVPSAHIWTDVYNSYVTLTVYDSLYHNLACLLIFGLTLRNAHFEVDVKEL